MAPFLAPRIGRLVEAGVGSRTLLDAGDRGKRQYPAVKGAGLGAQTGFAHRQDVFASRKIMTAVGVRAAPVAIGTALLADLGTGSTEWA
jgi:hypothetical protein